MNILIKLCLGVIFSIWLPICWATSSDSEILRVAMQLNSTVSDVIKTNPQLTEKKELAQPGNGIMTIRGPMRFDFKYGHNKQLDFDDVKLVIYPVVNSKIPYIHIFPQIANTTKNEMRDVVRELEYRLSQSGWVKHQSLDLNDSQVATGMRDYATFQLQLDVAVSSVKRYEITLTTFVDDSVKCGANTAAEIDSVCLNRFIRLGFYGFKL